MVFKFGGGHQNLSYARGSTSISLFTQVFIDFLPQPIFLQMGGVRLSMSMVQVVRNHSSENLLFIRPKGIHLAYRLSYLIFSTIFKTDVISFFTQKG